MDVFDFDGDSNTMDRMPKAYVKGTIFNMKDYAFFF